MPDIKLAGELSGMMGRAPWLCGVAEGCGDLTEVFETDEGGIRTGRVGAGVAVWGRVAAGAGLGPSALVGDAVSRH